MNENKKKYDAPVFRPWRVDIKGGPESSYEISVTNKPVEHSMSWGWGGTEKIILFDSGTGGNGINPKAYPGNWDLAVDIATLLCNTLNENKIATYFPSRYDY